MTRALMLVMVSSLTACSWDEAERTARCTREPASCEDGGSDAGGSDAGHTDAGATDAGTDAGTLDAGRRSVFFAADASVEPIGLYPASNDRIWLVANVGDDALIELRDSNGALVLSRRITGSSVVSAYGDGLVEPALAVLSDPDTGAARQLNVFREDGRGEGPLDKEGTDVSMYFDGTHSMVSLWNASTTLFEQEVFRTSGLATQGGPISAMCKVTVLDLQVLRPSEGGAVALAYQNGACDGGGAAEGFVANRFGGVATITPNGVRRSSLITNAVKVGGSLSGGLRFLVRQDDFNLSVGDGVFDGDTVSFVDAGHVGATGGLIAGDVSDDFVAFVSSGSISTGQTSGTANFPSELHVAHVAPWNVVQLGNVATSRVPVLRHADSVWVLWAPRDGGLQLTNLDPSTLVAR